MNTYSTFKSFHELNNAVREYLQDPRRITLKYGHISDWDVSRVTNMRALFAHHRLFNEDISRWDVSNVTDMTNMFRHCACFNQDITKWDMSKVTFIQGMLFGCSAFKYSIRYWGAEYIRAARWSGNKYMRFKADSPGRPPCSGPLGRISCRPPGTPHTGKLRPGLEHTAIKYDGMECLASMHAY